MSEDSVRTLAMMLIVAPAVVGCASIPTQSVSNQSMAAWKGKTVAFTSRPRPSMVMMTAGKGALGLIGVAAGVSAGNALVKEDKIPDPAPVVADELLQIAEKQYGVVPAGLAPPAVDTRNVAELAKAGKGADLLFDVESLGQGINYYPTDWSHYWLMSGLILRVVDVHTGNVVGEAVCRQNSQHQPNPPNKKELLANEGQLLKSMIAAQSDACRDEFAEHVLRANARQTASGTEAAVQSSQ
jgi:hypothetical protein